MWRMRLSSWMDGVSNVRILPWLAFEEPQIIPQRKLMSDTDARKKDAVFSSR